MATDSEGQTDTERVSLDSDACRHGPSERLRTVGHLGWRQRARADGDTMNYADQWSSHGDGDRVLKDGP